MAFKTDTIKLNTGYTTNPAGVEGQLALVGTQGNRVLKLYDDGSWANVSSGGGGGGGASELADLNDVPSAPSTQNDVGVIDGSNQLVFQKLTIDNIDSSALYSGSDFADDNTHLMTAQSIKNKIESYGYTTASNFLTDAQFGSAGIMATDGAGNYSVVTNNSAGWDSAVTWGDHGDEGYAKNYTWIEAGQLSENVIIPQEYTNQKFVMMGNPSVDNWKFAFANAASTYTDNTVIEIINHSDYNQTISTFSTFPMYLTNTQSQSTSDIVIERGQRALIMPKPANNVFFVSILVA